MCNKLAFLSLYLRIFPAKAFRTICWATIGIVALGTTSCVLATILECLPIEKNWNKQVHGHCINNEAFRWSWASCKSTVYLLTTCEI
jgi:hypothetical protein